MLVVETSRHRARLAREQPSDIDRDGRFFVGPEVGVAAIGESAVDRHRSQANAPFAAALAEEAGDHSCVGDPGPRRPVEQRDHDMDVVNAPVRRSAMHQRACDVAWVIARKRSRDDSKVDDRGIDGLLPIANCCRRVSGLGNKECASDSRQERPLRLAGPSHVRDRFMSFRPDVRVIVNCSRRCGAMRVSAMKEDMENRTGEQEEQRQKHHRARALTRRRQVNEPENPPEHQQNQIAPRVALRAAVHECLLQPCNSTLVSVMDAIGIVPEQQLGGSRKLALSNLASIPLLADCRWP